MSADFEPWSMKRGEILARFTTTEKLSIVSRPLSASGGIHFIVSTILFHFLFVSFLESMHGL